MKSIQEFCDKHVACQKGKEWALTNCKNMSDVWEKAKPEWLLWIATRPGVLSDRELRLFAVFCARQVQHLMPGWWSINAINVAERFANGEATIDELAAAWYAASAAASDAASAAAWYAASAAASDAASAAARAAASAAARDAAMAAQCDWLRKNTNPNFGG